MVIKCGNLKITGIYVYRFENRCIEDERLVLGDETMKIIVNTKGTVGDISDKLREVLIYLDEGRATGAYTKRLDEAVNKVKSSEERRIEYMTMMIHDMEVRAEGKEEGLEEGIDKTRIESIRTIMKKLKYTAQQAMEFLEIPIADRSKYATKL